MSPTIAVATLSCVAVACALVRLPRWLHPAWSARLLVVGALAATLSVVASVGMVAAAFVLQVAPHSTLHLPGASTVVGHAPVSTLTGATSMVVVALMALNVSGHLRSIWRERTSLSRGQKAILSSPEPLAFSLPGRSGGVVLSRGLRAQLSRSELRVVIEHEASHLRHRHHRYLLVGNLCAGAVPVLRGVERHISFAVERWADEEAAQKTGDRRLVARTIARVALEGTSSVVPAFSGSGVLDRVEAMLDDPPATSPVAGATLLATTGVTTSAMTMPALQFHHWIGLLSS